jgi:hypothetical protein
MPHFHLTLTILNYKTFSVQCDEHRIFQEIGAATPFRSWRSECGTGLHCGPDTYQAGSDVVKTLMIMGDGFLPQSGRADMCHALIPEKKYHNFSDNSVE